MVNVRNIEKDTRRYICHITSCALVIIMAQELNEQIQKLMEVHGEMERVRQIPPGILQSFQKRNSVREEFTVLKRIGETMISEGVQAALHRAQESMKADGGNLKMEARRVSRKRR